jgi:hypothetical protein
MTTNGGEPTAAETTDAGGGDRPSLDQMVDVTIEGDWFATLRVAGPHSGANEYVAQAQADLAEQGYVLDNEVTYRLREPKPGEQTRYATKA